MCSLARKMGMHSVAQSLIGSTFGMAFFQVPTYSGSGHKAGIVLTRYHNLLSQIMRCFLNCFGLHKDRSDTKDYFRDRCNPLRIGIVTQLQEVIGQQKDGPLRSDDDGGEDWNR